MQQTHSPFTIPHFNSNSVTLSKQSICFHSSTTHSPISVILTQPIYKSFTANITLILQSSAPTLTQPIFPSKQQPIQIPQQRLQDPRNHIKYEIPPTLSQQPSLIPAKEEKKNDKLIGGIFIGVIDSSKSNDIESYSELMDHNNHQIGQGVQLSAGPPSEPLDSKAREYINSSICSTGGLQLIIKYDPVSRQLRVEDLKGYFQTVVVKTQLEEIRVFIATQRSDITLHFK